MSNLMSVLPTAGKAWCGGGGVVVTTYKPWFRVCTGQTGGLVTAGCTNTNS